MYLPTRLVGGLPEGDDATLTNRCGHSALIRRIKCSGTNSAYFVRSLSGHKTKQRSSQLVKREVTEGLQKLNNQATEPAVAVTGTLLQGWSGVLDTPSSRNQTLTTNDILTAEQLSRILPLHPETIRRWARQGRIPHRRLGRKIIFIRAEIEAWIASGRLSMSVMSPNPRGRQA